MRFSTVVLGLVAVASAQQNYTACCDVAPNSVDSNTRLSWCRAQRNTCPELCQNGQVAANTCDDMTLRFDCRCASGTTPNISDYSQTLPSLQCDEWKTQCIAQHPNDLSGQNFCLGFTCGKRNATAGRTVPGGAGSTTSAGGSSPAATSPVAGSSSTPGAAVAVTVGKSAGMGAVLGVVALLFGVAL